MSDIVLDSTPKTDAEYSREFDAILTEIDNILAQMDKTSMETAQIRAETERLAAKNDATIASIKKQLDALWGTK